LPFVSAEAEMSADEVLTRALRAADRTARRGPSAPEAIVLYRSRRICLLLPEIATVVRLAPADEASLEAAARELDVSRYLAERCAPVVGPAKDAPEKPVVAEGFVATLWPHVDHTEAGYDDRREVARAAHALRRVHEAFADYPGALPAYSDRIEECGRLLRRADALPALAEEDRAFLLRAYDGLSRSLADFSTAALPIHGDAHMGNVFFTPKGPLWTDFETACLGPREWDAAAALHPPAFQPFDAKLYDILCDMRSLCVVVWCSALAGDPEKRDAARNQLAQLRRRLSEAPRDLSARSKSA
jgi:aminoglycoside phosphotransferase (APT) family kinase protein